MQIKSLYQEEESKYSLGSKIVKTTDCSLLLTQPNPESLSFLIFSPTYAVPTSAEPAAKYLKIPEAPELT